MVARNCSAAGSALAWRGSREDVGLVRFAAIVDSEAGREPAGRVARVPGQPERGVAEGQRVAILDDDVAARRPRLRPGSPDPIEQVEVAFHHDDPCAVHLLEACHATDMIVVAVGDHHVLDVFRVEADLPDVVEKAIDVAILECVDENQALFGGQQPARYITDADVVEIVERLER